MVLQLYFRIMGNELRDFRIWSFIQKTPATENACMQVVEEGVIDNRIIRR